MNIKEVWILMNNLTKLGEFTDKVTGAVRSFRVQKQGNEGIFFLKKPRQCLSA